jgi:hypothetical protein
MYIKTFNAVFIVLAPIAVRTLSRFPRVRRPLLRRCRRRRRRRRRRRGPT